MYNRYATRVKLADVFANVKVPTKKRAEPVSLAVTFLCYLIQFEKLTATIKQNWDHGQFRLMCMLAGCDYLPGSSREHHIKGVGLKVWTPF